MQKIVFLLVFTSFCMCGYSQKKKIVKKIAPSIVLAKADNLTAELLNTNFYLFITTKTNSKDTLLLKSFDSNKVPSECKIVPFTAKGTKLYCVSWTEKTLTETKLKTEDATAFVTEICDSGSKTKVLSNVQTTTKIKEIHFLDKNQTVSETLEKIRREGFEFSLNPQGDVVLKNKTQENKMSYNAANKRYENSTSASTKKKK